MESPSQADPCSDAAVRAWVKLIRAHRRALSSVERALRDAGLPTLEWYDVLLELERGGPLRPRELQTRLLLAQYNLSRLLDRMQTAGLVQRGPCPDDARGQWVRASASGKALRARMWPVYAEAIQRALGNRLSEQEVAKLGDLLDQLIT